MTLTVSALFVTLPATPPASASDSCEPGVDAYYAGGFNPAYTSTYGIRAKIETNPLNLCDEATGSRGFTYSFAMMTAFAADSENRSGWAQIGYMRFGSQTGFPHGGGTEPEPGTWNFTQYTTQCLTLGTCNSGNNWYINGWWGHPEAGVHIYTVNWNSADDRIHMRIDGTSYTHMGSDVSNVWAPSWRSDYESETWNAGDDVSGTAAQKTSFYFLQRQAFSGSWSYYTSWGLAPIADLGARHHAEQFTPADGLAFTTWTDPL